MNIGLTGSIATGKSTVSNLLMDKGALLVDADRIAREVVEPGSPVLDGIVSRFGADVLFEDGSLNRKKLGSIIFADEQARIDLGNLTHPAIRQTMREQMASFEAAYPDKLVVVDVPLLFESELQFMFHEVLLVYVPQELQIERLMQRDGIAREDAVRRVASQMPIEDKRRLADRIIDNSGSLEDTRRQVDALWSQLGLS